MFVKTHKMLTNYNIINFFIQSDQILYFIYADKIREVIPIRIEGNLLIAFDTKKKNHYAYRIEKLRIIHMLETIIECDEDDDDEDYLQIQFDTVNC